MDTVVKKEMEAHWRSDRDRCRIDARLELTIAEATQQGYALPDAFLSFMRSESARQRIPSCTACYFDAPVRVVAAPPPGNGILIRFMNDQQWCLLWFLYVEQTGAHAVVISDVPIDVDSEGNAGEEGSPTPSILLCSDDFEEF